jgi:hypothetical protein
MDRMWSWYQRDILVLPGCQPQLVQLLPVWKMRLRLDLQRLAGRALPRVAVLTRHKRSVQARRLKQLIRLAFALVHFSPILTGFSTIVPAKPGG